MQAGALLDLGGEFFGDVVKLALEPPDVLAEAAVQRPRGEAEAVLLGDQHLQQLPTPGEQGIEQLRGPHPLPEEREDRRVEPIGLGQLPRGPREVTDLARIGHDHRQSGRRARRHSRPLEAARGFGHDHAWPRVRRRATS